MKKYGIAILLFSIIFTCHAHDIKVLQLRYAGPVAVKKPILSDSLNVYGKAYEEINLLKNELSLTKLLNDSIILEADSKGKIVFSGLQDQYSLHLFSFNLIPDRFVKGKLKVTGPGMFEVYANGKKLKDKVTSDTLFFISTDLNLEPREYEISIKYLSPKEAKKESSLQIEYIYDDSSAVVEATVSNETRYTIYNLQDGKNFRSVALSPNGQYALVGYSERANAETESYKQLIETTTGKMILTEDGYLNEARWMPTSNLLYYTRKGLKGKELITLDPATLQENILDRELPEGSFYFTPDEKTLIFSIKEEGPKEENSMIRIVDPNDRQESYRTRYHLAIYSLSTGLLETLTYGYKTTQLQDISHDSRSILISTSEYDYTRRPFSSTSLYRIDLQTFKIDTIFQNQLYLGGFTFSPDDQQLMITGGPEAFNKIGLNIGKEKIANSYDNQLFIYDLVSRKTTPITRNFNPSVEAAYWNKSDNMIYALVEEMDYKRVYLFNPKTGDARYCEIPEELIKNFSVANDAPIFICYGQSVSNADKLYLFNTKKMESKLLYDLSAEKMKNIVLGEVHDWNFKAADGTEISGRYYLPPHFDPTKKYPLLVYYYGGTSPTNRALEFSYSMHMYAAQGYVVYTLNPSGTTGFGQEFSARHVNAWGKRTANEIIQGVKLFCKQHPFINEKKIGCFGASYGGFMTQYLQTQTDIFAAAISHAGISALSSYWGEGYWGIGYCSIANADSYPWNNSELFIKQSPLFNADKIKTPLLLLHGNADTNVPIGESIQMYNALRILGKPVEFIQIDGENHGVVDYHKRILWSKTMMAWFAKWLKDQPQWWEELYPERHF